MGEAMPIKAVFFDMGGVLLRTEDRSGRRRWEQRFGLPEWGLSEAVFNSEPACRATIGQGSQPEIWAHVSERFGLSEAELTELRRDFWNGDRFDERLIAFVASLRPRYRTGIITNAWPDAREFLSRHEFIRAAFETLIISAEIGVAKPDSGIYQAALEAFALAPDEAVFVDDVLENVEAARALGMAGVYYKTGMDVRAEFKRWGIA